MINCRICNAILCSCNHYLTHTSCTIHAQKYIGVMLKSRLNICYTCGTQIEKLIYENGLDSDTAEQCYKQSITINVKDDI